MCGMRYVKTHACVLALFLGSAFPAAAQTVADSGTFVVRHSGDTVATETFSRRETTILLILTDPRIRCHPRGVPGSCRSYPGDRSAASRELREPEVAPPSSAATNSGRLSMIKSGGFVSTSKEPKP